MKKSWVLSYPLSAQRRLWSDWVDAQADLSLRWTNRSFCLFCHEAANIAILWASAEIKVIYVLSSRCEKSIVFLHSRFNPRVIHACVIHVRAIYCNRLVPCKERRHDERAAMELHLCKQDSGMSRVMRKSDNGICEQERRRSACASAQSDQHIRCSLPR